jgi:hypothetical protein
MHLLFAKKVQKAARRKDNNYRTILATSQKSSPTPQANQRTFFYPIKLTDFSFQLKEKN